MNDGEFIFLSQIWETRKMVFCTTASISGFCAPTFEKYASKYFTRDSAINNDEDSSLYL